MAITTNLKKGDGVDLGNNLFAGDGKSTGQQTFNIIQANGVDLGRAWYKYDPKGKKGDQSCYENVGNIGFKNSAGVDVGTLLGKYGAVNCTCDTDTCECDCDSDTGAG